MEKRYRIYDFAHLEAFIEHLRALGSKWCAKWEKKQVYNYLNLPCSFDIETTSTEVNDEKIAYMYVWQLGVNGVVIIGRSWEQYKKTLRALTHLYELGRHRKMIIFVHNLEYEFQFFRKYFEIDELFASEPRRPIYCVSGAFEYRCSYILTGKKLSEVAKSLTMNKCSKMLGDLDYTLVHNPSTPLTKKEIKYAVNDVRIVMFYINEQIARERKVCNIPLTKTGYVRRALRTKVKKNIKDRLLMQSCTLTPESYEMAHNCYMGGFTHANVFQVGRTFDSEKNGESEVVASFDFTSSYPAVMLSEEFPLSSPRKVIVHNRAELEHYMKCYCCLIEIKLIDVKLKPNVFDAPLSESKCYYKEGTEIVVDNGRIRKISECITYITEVDFDTLNLFYTFDFEIGRCYVMQKGYLPKSYIEEILEYYEAKTTLKGVKGSEREYSAKKELLNSIYGMCVTDVLRDVIEYKEDWDCRENEDVEGVIEHYNSNINRCEFYPVGIYVSAYARRNLFTGIYAFGRDYIYSDTDSLKVLNYKNHLDYITDYNSWIKGKIKACLDYYNIPFERARPKTIEGEEKPLGVWDFEGTYIKFKTLGAKRYMVEKYNKKGEKEIEITVAGVNKKIGSKYMATFQNPFKAFDYGLVFDENHCGKLTHTYIDDEMSAYIKDYRGYTEYITAKSGIHLAKGTYNMSISQEYNRLQVALGLKRAGGYIKV